MVLFSSFMENTFTVAHNNDKSKSLQFRPSLIVKNMSTSKINKTNMFHCPNCKRFFSKQRSLKLHLPSCRRMHVAAEDSHYEVNYHPLRSCHYITDNNFSLNNDEYSNSVMFSLILDIEKVLWSDGGTTSKRSRCCFLSFFFARR